MCTRMVSMQTTAHFHDCFRRSLLKYQKIWDALYYVERSKTAARLSDDWLAGWGRLILWQNSVIKRFIYWNQQCGRDTILVLDCYYWGNTDMLLQWFFLSSRFEESGRRAGESYRWVLGGRFCLLASMSFSQEHQRPYRHHHRGPTHRIY